jgi:hypothetical protein
MNVSFDDKQLKHKKKENIINRLRKKNGDVTFTYKPHQDPFRTPIFKHKHKATFSLLSH